MAIPRINDFIQKEVKILAIKDLADQVKEITFEPLREKPYLPGQFIGIKIADNKGEPGFRAYSLLENKEGNFQICVKKMKDGRGSNFLHSCKKDDVLEVLFPLGYFGLPKKLSPNLIFIATGTGIVPILSLLKNLPQDASQNIKLFFGMRHEKDLFYFERVKKIFQKLKNASFLLTLSQPSEKWTGNKGRVTNFIEQENFNKNTQFFICGSGKMIQSMNDLLLKKGIKKKYIFFEDFNE